VTRFATRAVRARAFCGKTRPRSAARAKHAVACKHACALAAASTRHKRLTPRRAEYHEKAAFLAHQRLASDLLYLPAKLGSRASFSTGDMFMKSVILTALALSLTCLIGCKEDPITTIDRSMDCSKICDKYKSCLNSDYDTGKCEDRCTDMIDDAKTKKIDECEACVSGESCVGSVFKCTDDCAGIVP
jgi:hypothetical protein